VGIYRPRNRPHENDIARRGSMEITAAPRDEGIVEVRGPPRRRVTTMWSPRLQHDKRAAKRSIWKAPSLDEKAEGSLLSRRNVQIIMFTVGFVVPFGKALIFLDGQCSNR